MFLDTFLRGKSIVAAGRLHILLVAEKGKGVGALCDVCSRWGEIMERKGEEVGKTRNNVLETAVRDCRGLAFHIGPTLRNNSPCVGKTTLSWAAGPDGRFSMFLHAFLRGKSIEADGPN